MKRHPLPSTLAVVSFALISAFALCFAWEVTAQGVEPVSDEEAERREKRRTEKEKRDRGGGVGLDGVELKELEEDYEPQAKRFILPPYYQEKSEKVTFRTLFPLFFSRVRSGEGARNDLGVMPFYWRYREGDASADVFFPLYWRFRSPESKTDLVLQTYYNRRESGYNFGFAPFLFLGKDEKKKKSYQVVPPVFWNFRDKRGGFTWALWYYDHRERGDYDRGIPPLFFAGRNRDKTYLTVLPPLFWRFTDEVNYKTTTVLPPVFFKTRETGWSFGLLPLLYFAQDEKWARTLVTPFYYGSRWGEGRSHYLPLLLSYYRHSPTLNQGGVACFYHWYEEEGDYLKMYSPLVWRWGNERSDERSLLVPPVFYRHDSPVSDDTMVGLVYWNFHEHHRERTFAIAPLFAHNWNLYEKNWRTWFAPTFDIGVNPHGYHARLHPLIYFGKKKDGNHQVVAPLFFRIEDEQDLNTVVFPLWWNFRDLEHDSLSRSFFPLWWQFDKKHKQTYRRSFFPLFWDFKNEKLKERTTLALPIFWRDTTEERATTGVLNIVVNKGEIKNNPFWSFQLFPFIEFGKPPAPEGSNWSFLKGFLGWRRQGSTKELKLLWIPIDVSDDEDDGEFVRHYEPAKAETSGSTSETDDEPSQESVEKPADESAERPAEEMEEAEESPDDPQVEEPPAEAPAEEAPAEEGSIEDSPLEEDPYGDESDTEVQEDSNPQ